MRGTREGRRGEVEQFLAMEWGRGNGSGGFKIPLPSLRRILRSLRCPLRLCAPSQSVCTAATSPERRENPVSSLSWFTDQVNRPRPKNERKSAVQLLIPLAALRVPRFLCVGFSRLCGALSVYALPANPFAPQRRHGNAEKTLCRRSLGSPIR